MKLIQRYLYMQRTISIGAGTYNSSSAFSFTAQFNVILNKAVVTGYAADAVTSQRIEGGGYASITQRVSDNPGLTSSYETNSRIVWSTKATSEVPLHFYMTSLETFSPVWVVNLETVTANIIQCTVIYIVGYLCPEDYLGVDMFAAKLT